MTCRYGTVAAGLRLPTRKILVINNSVVPVAVDWYSFLVKPETEIMPFNVVVDVHTPFTDKLAKQLRASKHRSGSETHMENHLTDTVKSEIKNGSDYTNDTVTNGSSTSSSSSDDVTTSGYMTSLMTNMSLMMNIIDLDSNKTSEVSACKDTVKPLNGHECIEDEGNTHPDAIDQKETEIPKDAELKILILPYYGVVNTKACLVAPQEIFILPNDSASVTITVQPEKCSFLDSDGNYNRELFCKILGFLRIAPCDKYQDNHYARQDGTHFPPIEIDVTAHIVKPRLTFDIPKSVRTFTCCFNDVIQNKRKKLELKKTFFFYNNESNLINVVFETYEPFNIKSVAMYTNTNLYKSQRDVSINGHGCVEVVMVCIVDEELIQTLLHTHKSEDLHDSVITLTETLLIIHSDKDTQEVELILHIWLPSLKLSIYALDFGPVYIGDTKKLILVIENLSICSYKFNVKRKFNNKDFAIDQEEGILSGLYATGSRFALTVSFHPKIAGQSVETLKIITNDPYNTEDCELCGEGTLDQKYHIPGV